MAVIDSFEVGGTIYDLNAAALETPATIDGISFNGNESVTRYAACATAAGTAAKVVTLGTDLTLAPGAAVVVKFNNENTAASPTLNVNGTGAAPIMAYGTTAAGSGAWAAGQIVFFVYDGTNWVIAGRLPVDTTLSIPGIAAEAAAVGNRINYRTLKRMTTADYTNAISMANNTYMTATGSVFTGTLGNNFTWTLSVGQTYRLEKYPVFTTDSGSQASTVCYRLYSVGGTEQYGGYTISTSTDIDWYKTNTNETEFNAIKDIVDRNGTNVGFFGTSIMYGRKTSGVQSAYNLPAMYSKITGASCVNNGVSGQGFIVDFDTICGTYNSSTGEYEGGYDFTGYNLLVCNWDNANDTASLSAYPLGTGSDSEGTTTVLGYYNTFLKKIAAKYPTMRVVWISSKGGWSSIAYREAPYSPVYAGGGTSFTLNEFMDGLKALLQKYFFGFVDLRENNPINKYNYADIMIAEGTDGTTFSHFNDEGYKMYSAVCIAGINRFYTPVM